MVLVSQLGDLKYVFAKIKKAKKYLLFYKKILSIKIPLFSHVAIFIPF